MSDRVDRISLASGVAVVALGGLLLLDQAGVLRLTLGLFGAVLAAVIGTILLVSGLDEEGDER